MIGKTALTPLEFWGVADREFYFLTLKITYRNTVEENPYAAAVAWKHETCSRFGEAGRGEFGYLAP